MSVGLLGKRGETTSSETGIAGRNPGEVVRLYKPAAILGGEAYMGHSY